MPATRPTFGFDVTGLPGYRVEESRAPGGGYLAVVKAGYPIGFHFDEATGAHTAPTIHSRDYGIERRNTCKAAVAACHHHAEWVRNYKVEG